MGRGKDSHRDDLTFSAKRLAEEFTKDKQAFITLEGKCHKEYQQVAGGWRRGREEYEMEINKC